MKTIPEEFHDLIADNSPAIAVFTTLMPDGSPHSSPVWFSTDGEHILINSAVGRVKDRNVRARPQVAVVILDPAGVERYVAIRGRVVEFITAGADEHINALSHKYRGQDFDFKPGQQRVIYQIRPDKVFGEN
jgi:PPOX class probable F420-dependent enzyme